MLSLSPLSVTDRFSLSIDGLLRAVAARIAGGRMEAAMILVIWTRIKRIETRVLALVAAIRAGRDRGGWVLEPRVAGTRAEAENAPSSQRLPVWPRLPRGFAWLLGLVPYEAAGFASQLRHLLGDPEMVALLAGTPRLGKIMRPLCRMLGIEAELLSPVVAMADPVAVVDEGVAEVAAAEAKAGGLGFAVGVAAPAVVPGGGPDAGAWFLRWG